MEKVKIERIGKKPIYRFEVKNRYHLAIRLPNRVFESKKNAKKYLVFGLLGKGAKAQGMRKIRWKK